MNAKVILTALHGLPPGTAFVFSGPGNAVLGRANDCELQVPNDAAHRTVSRHHCLLTADPPLLWVRDLHSMNGTYVKTVNIGWHAEGEAATAEAAPPAEAHALEDGDALQVGNVLLSVHVLNESEQCQHRDTDVRRHREPMVRLCLQQ